jgi:hypothetical protein
LQGNRAAACRCGGSKGWIELHRLKLRPAFLQPEKRLDRWIEGVDIERLARLKIDLFDGGISGI